MEIVEKIYFSTAKCQHLSLYVFNKYLNLKKKKTVCSEKVFQTNLGNKALNILVKNIN